MDQKYKNAIGHALDAAWDATEGHYVSAAAHATEALLDLVGPGPAKELLDEATRKRINAEVDALEVEKFGKLPDDPDDDEDDPTLQSP